MGIATTDDLITLSHEVCPDHDCCCCASLPALLPTPADPSLHPSTGLVRGDLVSVEGHIRERPEPRSDQPGAFSKLLRRPRLELEIAERERRLGRGALLHEQECVLLLVRRDAAFSQANARMTAALSLSASCGP